MLRHLSEAAISTRAWPGERRDRSVGGAVRMMFRFDCHEGRLKWRGRYQGTKAPQAIQTDIAQEQALGLGQIEERFFDATCDSEDADCTTNVTVL